MNPWLRGSLLVLLLAGLTALSCGDPLSPVRSADAPSTLSGRVVLQNQANHYGVTVTLGMPGADTISLITDAAGDYTIPFELHAGQWTLTARFPFFDEESVGFEVKNGLPTSDLSELVLPQVVTFRVFTDKMTYRVGETVAITLLVSNISDREITLRSETAPLLAVAVARDGEILVGSLMPGEGLAPEEVTIPGGSLLRFFAEWNTAHTAIEPGPCQVYALLAASSNYPDYFSADAPELNHTLLDKLVPAEIELTE